MKKFIVALALMVSAPLGGQVLLASPASAHTAEVTADCDGVRVHGENYDGSADNRWSVTIDGETTTGTFGDSVDKVLPVPQGGATTDWSGFVEAEDGSYHFDGSGTVGPCGEANKADAGAGIRKIDACGYKRDAVMLKWRRHATVKIDRVKKTRWLVEKWADTGHTFADGSDHKRKVVRLTLEKGCGGTS